MTSGSDTPPFERLHLAAGHAHEIFERGAGIAEQIAAGGWDKDLTADQARNLADELAESAEKVRTMRSDAGLDKFGSEPAPQWSGLLPFNRKERFFTGTVFPCLVADTGFWHIQRVLDLFKVPATASGGESAKIQLLTEYGFAESVFTDEDKAKWGTRFSRQTPDIVIAGPDWLLAIEAKMYHSPTAAALVKQMGEQAPIIDRWQSVLSLPKDRVVHALLLPDRLATRERSGLDGLNVVTWEALLDEFREVGPRYWVAVLAEALRRHEALESRVVASPMIADTTMTGAEIVAAYEADDPEVMFVGRAGGAAGAKLATEAESGAWMTETYQVRADPPPTSNPNWMPVHVFVSKVEGP